ncbi:MAG: peptidase, partial [Spirochaeta sp.]|nr:peptidase [Spirochaeta sp.]
MKIESGVKKKKSGMSAIIASLRDIKKELYPLREILLANLVMIAEIPAPTFYENERIRFIKQRFTEAGLQNCSTDEMGNALAIMQGRQSDKNIVVSAHTDTIFPATIDHTITVLADSVRGPGVGTNALGAAVIVTLPTILQRLGIELNSNLVLMGSTRSLGRGNLEGLRFFLSNTEIPIQAGLCLEGMQLGRLSHNSIGMLRCQIECTVPEEYDWTRFNAAGAIIIMNEIINKILEIPLSRRPHASIVVGSIEGGKSFDTISTHALLRLEIYSG